METLIILIGAIIILSVAFYMAREKSFLPPENMQIAQESEFKDKSEQSEAMGSKETEISSATESTVQNGTKETPGTNSALQEGMTSTSSGLQKEELVTQKEEISDSVPEQVVNPDENANRTQAKSESATEVTKQTIQQSNETNSGPVFTVQVGYFSVEKNARSLAEIIKTQGFQTFVFKHNNAYKVQVGAYHSRIQAEKASQELKKLGYEVWVTQR
ncbi:MAG: SPOR domain-containing protein [Candidatus Atribacteria bacterium]|nr:SPOR domain-containing protein [Candidatus Atribacteria bacterium]